MTTLLFPKTELKPTELNTCVRLRRSRASLPPFGAPDEPLFGTSDGVLFGVLDEVGTMRSFLPRIAVFALILAVSYGMTPSLAAQSELDQILRQAGTEGATSQLAAIDEYLGSHPSDVRALFLRARFLHQLDRSDEARAVLTELARARPAGPEVFNNLAALYASDGDLETASELLKAGIRSQESFRVAHENLNLVLGKLAGKAYSQALGDHSLAASGAELSWIEDLTTGDRRRSAPVPRTNDSVVADGRSSGVAAGEAVGAANSENGPVAVPNRASAEAQEVEGSADERAALLATVESWAAAWSNQNADAYLDLYSSRFRPDDGLSVAEWRTLRQARLLAPAWIEVSVALQDFEWLDGDRAAVRFIQSYRSDVFSDTVNKQLDLVRENGWKIVRETAE